MAIIDVVRILSFIVNTAYFVQSFLLADTKTIEVLHYPQGGEKSLTDTFISVCV